jgi:hypothetical protein
MQGVNCMRQVLRLLAALPAAGLLLALGSVVTWESWLGGEIFGTRMAGWPFRWLAASIDMHPLAEAQRQAWLRSFVYLNEQTIWSLRWPQLAADWLAWTFLVAFACGLAARVVRILAKPGSPSSRSPSL